jgi:hypothetical protein
MEGDPVHTTPQAQGIAGTRLMQEQKVDQHNSSNNERKQEMEGKEPIESGIVHCEATSDPLNDHIAYVRYSRDQIRDHRCSPKRHLSPWKNVSHEGCSYRKKEEKDARHPSEYELERAIVHATTNVEIQTDEEERCSISMDSPEEPAIVDVPNDVSHAIECKLYMRGIVHSEEETSQELSS